MAFKASNPEIFFATLYDEKAIRWQRNLQRWRRAWRQWRASWRVCLANRWINARESQCSLRVWNWCQASSDVWCLQPLRNGIWKQTLKWNAKSLDITNLKANRKLLADKIHPVTTELKINAVPFALEFVMPWSSCWHNNMMHWKMNNSTISIVN